jgi:hypothetical protein
MASGGDQENWFAQEPSFANGFKPGGAGKTAAGSHELEEFQVVDGVKGQSRPGGGDGGRIPSVPEGMDLDLGVILVPPIQLLSISRVQEVNQEVMARARLRLQHVLPEERWDHTNPLFREVR